MKIKDLKLFRKLYKEKVRGYTDSNRNENFVGHSLTSDNKTIYGFFEIYHGDKPNIGKFITPFLDMAEDWQAVYELIQNASDSESSYFGLFFDDNYLLAINNGKQFSFEGVRSILNIAQSPKDSKSNIGKFGVGFKIVHKLIGKSNGKNELLNYEGPIVFSWNYFEDLKDLSNLISLEDIDINDFDLVKKKDTFECSNDSSWLFKILLTNFPCGVNDKILDLDYLERSDIISEHEINKLSEFVKKYVIESEYLKKNDLKSGSIIFLKLGIDKYKQIQQNHIGNGIDYSLNILNAIYGHSRKGIKKILINEDSFEPGNIYVEAFQIYPEDKEFEIITSDLPETERPEYAELIFGYPKNINDVTLKSNPNIYLYFPLSDEQHNFNFLIHCNTFHNLSQRTNLGDSKVNRQILSLISKKIISVLEDSKESDFEKYINIYSCILNSSKSDKQNKLWVNTCIYDVFLEYIKGNIPSSEKLFLSKDKIRIKKTALELNRPLDFGVKLYQWLYFTDNEYLMKEASDSSKLDISTCTVFNLIKDTSDLEISNNWLTSNMMQNERFLDELNNDSKLQKINRIQTSLDQNKFINNLRKLRFLLFDNDEFYSIEDILEKDKFLICFETVFDIRLILCSMGFNLTKSNFSEYRKLFDFMSSDIKYLKDKSILFDIISKETIKNELSKKEKESLFLSFIEINSMLLSNWVLFKNENNEIKPLENLISAKCDIPIWLNQFKIHHLEYFETLDKFLVQDSSIYSKIIKPNWEQIISDNFVKENPCNLYKQVINYYEQDEDKIELNGDLILSISLDFKPVNEIYFHRSLIGIENYDFLAKLVTSNSNLHLPNKQILTYLEKEPFNLREKSLLDDLIYPVFMTENELKELIVFLNLSKEEVFSKVVIKKDKVNNKFEIIQKTKDNFQYYSENNVDIISEFIEKNHIEKYFELPNEISNSIHNKTDLLTEKEILELILEEKHDPKNIFHLFIDSDSEDIKVAFLNYIPSITLSESSIYDKNSFEYNIFKLVRKYLSDDEEKLENFRTKIFIENIKGEKRKLSEVAYNNKVRFSFDKSEVFYDLELSKILPSYEDKSGLIENIITHFIGFNDYDLRNRIFKVGTSIRKENILKELTFELVNSHQFTFLVLMIRYSEELIPDISKYSYQSKTGIKNLEIYKNYYINDFDFINKDYILNHVYNEMESLLKLNNDNPFFTNSKLTVTLKPFFQNQTFDCSPIKINQYKDSKSQKDIFLFLFEEYCTKHGNIELISFKKTSYLLNNIADKIYGNENKKNILGFNPEEIIMLSEFALEEENAPDWVNEWIEKGQRNLKLKFLKALGVKDEESDIVELRKFLVNKKDTIDDIVVANITSESSIYITRTIVWLLFQAIKYKPSSNQLKCLVDLLKTYAKRDKFPIIIINTVTDNQIKDYMLKIFDDNNVNSYWLVNNKIIEDLKLLGNNVFENIFDLVRKKNDNLIHINLFEKTYLEKFPINFLEYELLLDSDYLLSVYKEFEKPYYKIWKNELSEKFRIFTLSNLNENNLLRYSLVFEKEHIQSVFKNKIDIDEKGNIFIAENGNIEEYLKEILEKNGFEQKHLDLLSEKKQFEPEEIDNYFKDIYTEPTTEFIENLEEQTSRYFPEGEKEDFDKKLINLLNAVSSPWGNGFIFHFTHIENALAIIKNMKIYSRNYANIIGFSDAASSEQINRTRSSVHNFARFYFRPLTPTQWHNEGLGRNRYQDNPKCPIPIFFKINIEDVLNNNISKCYVSNGNLSSDWAKYGNTYEFLKKFDFLNLYSNFGNLNFKTASQQEFIVQDLLDLSDIHFEIICRTNQDRDLLINLLGSNSELNINVDSSFYHNENPFIIHKKEGKITEISLSNMLKNNYRIKLEYETELDLNKIEGNFIQLNNNEDAFLEMVLNQDYPSSSLEFKNSQNYSIYYIDESNNKWFIYSTNKSDK